MQTKEKEINIRFVSNHGLLESSGGHPVRTITELRICEWLTVHGIDHQHAGEVLTVKAAANGLAGLFVPDIMLTKKTKDRRTIIIEALHSFSPKRGGLKNLTAFRTQYKDQFLTIVVGKKATLDAIPKSITGIKVELEQLDMLGKRIAQLMS